jgi:adenylate cyclase, class 2
VKEVEVKILEIDRARIEKTLLSLGARRIFDDQIQTIFYDFPSGSIVKAKSVLRLRKNGDTIELTYKKVRFTQIAKTAEEYSVEVSNLETMKKILENLGLVPTEVTQKHRVSFLLEGARFDIDRYLGDYGYVPEFMEIEAENTNLIKKYANLLGFSQDKCLPWSTNDIVQYYSSRKKS